MTPIPESAMTKDDVAFTEAMVLRFARVDFIELLRARGLDRMHTLYPYTQTHVGSFFDRLFTGRGR